MKKKVFSLMMTLLLAFVGVAKAELVEVGVGGTTTNSYLPCYTFYNNTLSQQIYTADEIGMAGTINSIAFYNGGSEKTPNFKFYMVNTSKTSFSNTSDWITVSASDLVFEGSVTLTANAWTTITLSTPFEYDGTSNLALITDEYMSWSSGLACRVFEGATNCSLYSYDDNVDFNATSPTTGSYSNCLSVKNQLQLDITAGGGAGGEEVLVEIGDGTSTNYYGPYNSLWGYSFVEQIYTADEIGTAGNITSIGYNMESSSAQTVQIDIFMKNVSRTEFANSTDWETVTASDMVYSGTITFNQGWTTITLDTPFAYDGTSNLMIGMHEYTYGYSSRYFYYTSVPNALISGHNDSVDPNPYDMASFTGTTYTQNYRNNIQIAITSGGDEPEEPVYEEGLHTLATYGVGEDAEELIDLLHIQRPNGAWMEPYHFQLYNDGDHSLDVLYIDFLHNNGYFSMDEETTEYPFTVPNTGLAGAVDLYINTNTEWTDTEVINSLLAVNTDERSTHLFQIIAEPYTPYCPDVFEKAYRINNITAGEPWSMWTSEMWDEINPEAEYELHDNYTLPFPEIPEGYDAVMTFTLDHDMMLNAFVSDGDCDTLNGKVALYRADFAGEAGPMADNNYTGRPFHNEGGAGGSGEITVHEGTVTNTRIPAYVAYFDDFAKSQCVYPASELSAMNGSSINTIKWYTNNYNIPYTTVTNVNVYMKEVNAPSISEYVPMSSCQVVYTGTLEFVAAGDGGECTINLNTPYHYNGGNLLVGIENVTDAGYKFIYFLGETITGASIGGSNSSSTGTIPATQQDFLPKTTFVYGGRSEANNRDAYTYGFESGLEGWSVIDVNSGEGTWVHSDDNPSSYDYTELAHGGTGFAMCYSFVDYVASYDTDSYLISPQMYSIGNGANITFWADNANDDYPEWFGICVSTSATPTVSSFTQVWGGEAKGNRGERATVRRSHDNRIENWRQHTVDLSAYAGQNVWIAFHDVNYDAYEIWIDDVTVNAASSTPTPPTPPTPVDPDQPVIPTPESFSAGPVIENLNVLAGTYYLVASSTCEDFEVTIDFEELPCPIAPVTNIYPADNAFDIPSNDLTLLWTLNDYCNEWRIVFGSTYYPEDEPNHPATYISDWSSDLAESLRITDYVELWDNTNYFWRIEQRSNPGTDYECVTSGPVFGFTTRFDVPQNLQVNGVPTVNIFETEEDVTLTWNRIYDRNNRNNDRTFRRYRIYWNGELYDETTENDVTELSYTIPNSEFHYNMVPRVPEEFNVTAVYDEGESPFSNTAYVQVSGYGTVSGTAYEQDEVTPIGGVTVIITGTNEFGDPEEYTFTTDEDGYYEGEVHVGTYTDAMAYMDGYQSIQTIHPLPFNVVYNQETDHVDFIIDETFYYPAHVCARPVYVPGVVGDTLVQVWWDGWASEDGGFVPGGAFEAQIGEGTGNLTYAPFHTLWNYSLSETLYRADELAEAGVTGAAMTSLSYYVSSTTCTTPQNNISIWMANVPENELTATSYTTNNMTLVYTGNNVLPVAGQWNEFVFNQGNFSWDGQSNIVIVCQRLHGDWQGSVSWRTHNPGFTATAYDYDDYEVYNCQANTYSMYTSNTNRPDIIMKAGSREAAIGDVNRALHHFNIYRTDCYNDGPYNSENTVFLASVWRPDTSYFDVQWPEVPVGVYKYGVSAVYSGNQADNPNNPRIDYPFEERESEIMWSDACGPCIDKDMQTDITVNVVCNSADSPEGCVVSFTNLNEGEQFNHPQPSITLDASGFQAITPFRKGDYLVTVYLPGYELLQVEESIWGHRDLRYVLTEIIYGVKNLYVSRTGWAMWDPETWEDYPIPTGAITGPSIIDFETGDFSQFGFTNSSSYPWTVANEGRGYCMKSGNAGIASSTSTISATVNYTMAGTVEFDANCMGEGTSTYWDKCIFKIDGTQMFSHGADLSGWHDYSYPVAAGEHTFTWEYSKDGSVNPTGDCFLVDNINFNMNGGRAVAEERHLEGYKIMCTSIDDEPIFNHNTPVDQPFCQLTTVDPWSGQDMLIEGEYYKVKVATIYSTGQSPWSEAVIWQYEPCDHWGPVDEVTVGTTNQGNHIEWVFEHGHNQWIDPNDPDNPDPTPGENATIVLSIPSDVWGDGSGYQMLLDADATAYGTIIPETGGLTTSGNAPAGVYDNFEYKIPENADGNLNTSNILVEGTLSITIPAGTYDWCITNPTPGDRVWIASSNGNIPGRYDDYEFEAGKTYTFTVSMGGTNDRVDLTITDSRGRVYGFTSNMVASTGECRVNPNPMPASAEIGLYQGGSFYNQYAEDGIMLNFLALDNVDLRAYMLFNLVKDNRFSLMAESNYGQFVVTPAFDMNNFMGEFESFYNEAEYSFRQLSKYDIMDRMNEWKNAVGSQNFLSITMDVALSHARVENDQCINSLPFCTSEVIEFEAASTSSTAQEENMDDGCIGSSYNPSFYHMRIHTGGPFVIHMEGHDPNNASTTRDIDFCMWGPYTEQEIMSGYACTHLTGDKIMDCCYSASYTEDVYLGYPDGQHQHNTSHGSINYHVPQVGEYYVLMITNYSQQPCVINFTKTEGEGETDCDIVTPSNIIGFLITQDGEYLDIVGPDVRDYTDLNEFGDHEYCVRPIYPGPAILPDSNYYFSMGCPVCASVNGEITCEPGAPIYAEVNGVNDQVHIYWGEQPEPGPEPGDYSSFSMGFEGVSGQGLPSDWTTIDADGDGNDWYTLNWSEVGWDENIAHGGDTWATSASYASSALTPDNYLVSPQVTLGGTLTFWACAQDASWAGEHFGVAVSTSGNTSATDFTTIQEWTMTAKGVGAMTRDTRDGGNRAGTWYQYTVDLSDYAGLTGYVAIRHFNCTDMFRLNVDDIEMNVRGNVNRDGIVAYNIYRSTDNVAYDLIGTVAGDVTEYFDAPEAGTYYYQVTAVYEDGCESEPAVSGENPEVNYVMVGVTGIGENSDEVALFPNPTKGNVTIQAMNMHRVTVVSVLGQVVYDTEVDQDEYILNMSQFNTGLYMVRVYTDNGVTVKRVTVLH